MDSINNFYLYKDFDCSLIYSNESWEKQEPKYHFNCAEKTGNVLVEPFRWVCITLKERNNRLSVAVAAVASIFASFLALFAVILKKIGEKVNANSPLREQAISKRIESLKIEKEISVYNDNGLTVNNLENSLKESFNKNIVSKVPSDVKQDVYEPENHEDPNLTMSFFDILADASKPKTSAEKQSNEIEKPADQKGNAFELRKKFENALQTFLNTLSSQQNTNAAENEIKNLVQDDEETATKAKTFLTYAKLSHDYTKVCLEYNKIVAQISS